MSIARVRQQRCHDLPGLAAQGQVQADLALVVARVGVEALGQQAADDVGGVDLHGLEEVVLGRGGQRNCQRQQMTET